MTTLGGMRPHMSATPFLQITEQPKQRGMRFRYECEGRSAGSIPGENTTPERKSWPAVQIRNYVGKVRIRVSLVTKDTPPRSHPHSLVGKDCENGICQVEVSPDTQMGACFSNLGIQCVKRREVQDALQERRRQGVDPFNTYRESDEHPSVDIDLATVRLCFEGFVFQNNQFIKLKPEVSNPIFDKKSTASSLLRICRVDKSYGSCKGGEEVYLLCDKVQKDDISICFYEKGGWEAYGEFSPTDVHRQVAIVFRTPPYKDSNIRHTVKVFFQLKRTSDGQTSESKEFTYLPMDHAMLLDR